MVEKLDNWNQISQKEVTNKHSDSQRERVLYTTQIGDKRLNYESTNIFCLSKYKRELACSTRMSDPLFLRRGHNRRKENFDVFVDEDDDF